jgi:hypothetical protein
LWRDTGTTGQPGTGQTGYWAISGGSGTWTWTWTGLQDQVGLNWQIVNVA